MVKSDVIYSPQNFVEEVTGKCYIFQNQDTVFEIQELLKFNGYDDLWDYPLSEIDEISPSSQLTSNALLMLFLRETDCAS